MDQSILRNRRHLIRYSVRDRIFITFRPDFDRVGLLKDVSMGGLSFEYTSTRSLRHLQDVYVDIFSYQKSYTLTGVRCKVIYDNPICDRPSFGNIGSRRCGVLFRRLSRDQLLKLKVLINEYTVKSGSRRQ